MDDNWKNVALIVETSLASGRQILRGIARYARESGRWRTVHAPRGLEEGVPAWLAGWRGDGVVARIQSPLLARELGGLGVPVVDVLGVVPHSPFPLVHVDDRAVAGEAARHFHERGFRHFGFFGIAGENWSERRREGFRQACRGEFAVLETPRGGEAGSEESLEVVRAWLRELPKPVGILVASDQRGPELLEACRLEGLDVPERVAVVGVDNDVPLCEISHPPLSSVRAGHFQVGYEAARLLGSLMAARLLGSLMADTSRTPRGPLLVPPVGTVVRGSSDTVAVADPVVAAGLRFLRENLERRVSNDEIARAAGVSRTAFQKRFRDSTGESVRTHLIRLRLRRASDLIEGSKLSLKEIAWRCGFRHQEYLGDVFRRHYGLTPGEARKRAAQNGA